MHRTVGLRSRTLGPTVRWNISEISMARDMIETEEDFRETTKNPEWVRSRWITELRRQGDRQCRNAARVSFSRVCSMELLREITGAPWTGRFGKVGALAGLTYDQVLEGISRNDGRCGFHPHTFDELADWLEGLPRA